jgi:hypothetical protein
MRDRLAVTSVTLVCVVLAVAACSPHVIVATGTTIGIKATPGDGQTRPPQLVVGYKRAEAALVPVDGTGSQRAGAGNAVTNEAASVVSSFYLKNQWTSETQIRSFIGTGFAAREIVGDQGALLKSSFAAATGDVPSPDIVGRQQVLIRKWAGLNRDEAKAQRILDFAKYSKKTNKTAVDSLQEYIVDSKTDQLLTVLESAFAREP